jgi:hypothetical protein
MRKIVNYLPLLLVVLLYSCASPKYIAPKYTSTSEILKIKGGMSIDEVSAATGLEPYDFYENSSTGSLILVYKYRLKDRRRTITSEKQLHNEEGQIKGDTWYQTDEKELYVTYKNGKVANFVTKNGRKHGEDLAVLDNNIRKIQKDQLNSYVIYWQKLLEEEAKRKANIDTIIVIRENNEKEQEVASKELPADGKPEMVRSGGGSKFFSWGSNFGLIRGSRYDGERYKGGFCINSFMEGGGDNFAVGLYINALSNATRDLQGSPYFDQLSVGLHYKKFFAPTSSKIRPYARIGAGISSYYLENPNGQDKDGVRINFMLRGGVELYATRWLGISAETGFGAMNVFSIGMHFRLAPR